MITTGTGRPGVTQQIFTRELDLAGGKNFIIAPSGDLTLEDAHVFTHRIMLTVPLEK